MDLGWAIFSQIKAGQYCFTVGSNQRIVYLIRNILYSEYLNIGFSVWKRWAVIDHGAPTVQA
jgi:hypothetical protein